MSSKKEQNYVELQNFNGQKAKVNLFYYFNKNFFSTIMKVNILLILVVYLD